MQDDLRKAYQQAEKAYGEAIDTRAMLDSILYAVPVGDKELYKRVLVVHETCVQSINAAWKAKRAIEDLMY